jgi:S1-C subfamily serine protease
MVLWPVCSGDRGRRLLLRGGADAVDKDRRVDWNAFVMGKHSDSKLFLVAFLGTAVTLLAGMEFGLFERLSYEVEKGRLRALRETSPAGGDSDQVLWTRRAASLASPAVVSIETAFAPVPETDPEDSSTTSRGTDADDPGSPGLSPDGTDSKAGDTGESADPGYVHQGLGSGFVFDATRGHILTNAHVVDGAREVTVTLQDGREAQARVLGLDPVTDLAVIQVDLPRLYELGFADSEAVMVGDDVLAIGSPLGLDGTVSKGIISAVNRKYVAVGGRVYGGLLQTDAAITTGSSGGPLVDMHGDVVGINTAMATSAGEYDGVGFAIPASRVLSLVSDLIEGGPGFLGIYAGTVNSPYWQSEAAKVGWTRNTGAIVTDILRNTAAEEAGLEKGDIILSVDGTRVDSIEELSTLLAETSPGTEVTLGLWHDGKAVDLPVKIGRKYAPR